MLILILEYSDSTDDCDNYECRKWLRIRPPRRPNALKAGLFESFSHTTKAQIGPNIHSVLNFCPGNTKGILVEKWRSFDDSLGIVAEDSSEETSRKRRSTEGMIQPTQYPTHVEYRLNHIEDYLYKDYLWDRVNNTSTNINWGNILSTFDGMAVPHIDTIGGINKRTGHNAQKCIWCDISNENIDMMRNQFQTNVIYPEGRSAEDILLEEGDQTCGSGKNPKHVGMFYYIEIL